MKKTKKKINILKITSLITQILAIIIMAITKNKIVYTICMIHVINSYFYIMTYKKGSNK